MISSKIVFAVSPFLFSSKLDHTTCPDLLLVIEALRYEMISFSLLKDRLQLGIHTVMVSIICKTIRRMSGGLQGATILSCMTSNHGLREGGTTGTSYPGTRGAWDPRG